LLWLCAHYSSNACDSWTIYEWTALALINYMHRLVLRSCNNSVYRTSSERDRKGNGLYYSLLTPPTRTRQDKTVLSCTCRRCEQAITDNAMTASIARAVAYTT